jgi:hypothetical protein
MALVARKFSCAPANPLAHTVSASAGPVAVDSYELRFERHDRCPAFV